jgi:hypothetical protein
MAVVKGFKKGEVNLARLNFAKIIHIPKEEGANTLKKFRPISLINCSFKIFAKPSTIDWREYVINFWPLIKLLLCGGDISCRVWCQPMRSSMTLSRARRKVWCLS